MRGGGGRIRRRLPGLKRLFGSLAVDIKLSLGKRKAALSRW